MTPQLTEALAHIDLADPDQPGGIHGAVEAAAQVIHDAVEEAAQAIHDDIEAAHTGRPAPVIEITTANRSAA